jgi:ribosomal protein L29
MDIKELREKTAVELERLLAQARNRMRELRFKVAAKQLTDVREIRETRKLIAQIMTLKPKAPVLAKDGQGQVASDDRAEATEAKAAAAGKEPEDGKKKS